jgi:hypothetical protein
VLRNFNRADTIGLEVPNPQAAAAQRTSYRTPDGRIGTAVFDPNTRQLTDVATGEVLPEGTTTGIIQDTAEGLGSTNSNLTDYNRVISTVTTSNMLLDDLERLIQSQSGAAGLPGTIQSLGQDLLQVGLELGAAFSDDPDKIITPDMLSGVAGRVAGTGAGYNPVFREIRTGLLQLAYLNAQRDNPRGEVSRFALERQIEALGQGALGNDQSTLAALGMARRANDRAVAGAEAMMGRGGQGPASPAQGGATPPPPAAVQLLQSNPTPTARAQFDEVFGQGAAAQVLGE